MNCATVRKLLPALAGGDLGLSREDAQGCTAHVADCGDCARRLASLNELLGLLHRTGRQVGSPEALPTGFQASLRQRLAQEPPPVRPLRARLWGWLEGARLDSQPRLILAGCAMAALVFAVPALHQLHSLHRGSGPGAATSPVDHEVAAAFQVPQQRIAVVRFDFVADVEVPEVEFEVTLPSELDFIDEGKALPERRIVWRGSLASGSNPIPLAVRGSKPGRYRVTAQARGEGLAVRHDILLEVVRS